MCYVPLVPNLHMYATYHLRELNLQSLCLTRILYHVLFENTDGCKHL